MRRNANRDEVEELIRRLGELDTSRFLKAVDQASQI